MTRTKPIVFQQYPELEDRIEWKQFISTSTPVERMDVLEKYLGYSDLWVKRDDQTGTLYGGNKTRKLEFIIAHALARKSKWILTFGGLGSNHALATAIYSRDVGIKTVLALIDQPVTEHVKKQLLRFVQYGAKISYAKNTAGAVLKGLWHLLTKKGVYFLGPGGTNEIGNLGFVEAALELAAQIEEGLLPKPKRIFLALGSMGTYAGLKVGFRLANLDIDLIGVRVTDIGMTDEKKTLMMTNNTAKYLNAYLSGPSISLFNSDDIHIEHGFAGPCYGSVTEEGKEALEIARDCCNLGLETTYTAKAFACMVDFVRNSEVGNEPLLFWNTYSSVDLSDSELDNYDFRDLPKSFHKFFRDV